MTALIFPLVSWFYGITILEETLTGTITLSRSGPERNSHEGVTSYSPELEPHHWMQFRVIYRTLFWSVCVESYLFVGDEVSIF